MFENKIRHVNENEIAQIIQVLNMKIGTHIVEINGIPYRNE